MMTSSCRNLFLLGAPCICPTQAMVNTATINFQTKVSDTRKVLLENLPFCLSLVFRYRKVSKKLGKREHHLWKRIDSAGSGQKAMNLVRIVSGLPNEKEAVYSALDEWIAWELEFPLIAAAKALIILKKQRKWLRVFQVAKWMLSKG